MGATEAEPGPHSHARISLKKGENEKENIMKKKEVVSE